MQDCTGFYAKITAAVGWHFLAALKAAIVHAYL